ncbi:hypothetical protein MD484_g5623, partial [Candolleomyces efflorescens]
MSHSRSRRRRRPYEQQLRSPSPELSSDGGDVSSLSETTVTNSVAALPGDVSLNDIANMLAGLMKRGRCCGIFWKWPFTEQLVKNTQTGQFWPNTSYRREDNLEEAWAEYQRAKLAGEVYLVARQPGDRDLFGPEDLCVM